MKTSKKATESAQRFAIAFDGTRPVFAKVGKKSYTFIARFRGLIGETLYAVNDEKMFTKFLIIQTSARKK